MTHPIPVEELGRELERLRADSAELSGGRAAWAAFVELAHRPVEAGGASTGISEDLLMFDVAAHEDHPLHICLVRRVGLEDEAGDYIESRVLECLLFYDRANITPDVRSGCVRGWLHPEVEPHGVAAFVEQAQATGAYRLLVERREPTEIVTSFG